MVALKSGEQASWEVPISTASGPPVGETSIRRSYCLGKKEPLLRRPREGIDTMVDVANYAADVHGDREFLGTRPLLKVHPAEGGLELYELGPYSWLSFVEVRDLMFNVVGPALRQLGLGKPAGVRNAADAPFINIYSESSLNWRLVSMGATSISSPFSTAFSTLDPDGVKHTINQPGCVAVFTQGELLAKLAPILPDCRTVKTVIYDGKADPAVAQRIQDAGVRLVSMDELLQLGRANPARPTPPQGEDLMAVMYTSGTFGPPKGVEVTHAMMVSGIAGIDRLLDDHYVNTHQMSHCAFLPLAHAIEQINTASLWFQGVKSGFGRARTLMATGVKNCEGDLAELKPTTICAVPLVWETIRKGVELQLSQASPVTRALFNASYWAKEHGVPGLAQAGDAVVLSKVRAFTGGRLDACLSGGAALSESTSAWFKHTGIASVMNGWGLTETLGMGFILHPSIWSPKGHGCVMPCVEVKLVDRPESGYRSTDALPSGEILIRGPAVFKRYFKNEEETAGVFEDGWFKTGDVGRWTKEGTLEIVDRVKNLVKMPNGEYLALEKLESVYKAAPLVSNLILTAAVGADALSGIVIAHPANLLSFLQARHLLPGATPAGPSTLPSLVRDPAVQRAVLGEINAFGRQAGLSRRELLGAVVLTTDEWTPENGLVTATFKPKRKAIEARYAAELQAANAPRARL